MPLFGSGRDAYFLKRINQELINRIIAIEILIYRINIEASPSNIYDESNAKSYYSPLRLDALISQEDTLVNEDDAGLLESTKNISFAFHRDDLVQKDLRLQIGDIIEWDGRYHEIGNIRQSNYWWNKNPDTYRPYQEERTPEFGYSVSVVAETHRARISSLNIVDERSGNNPIQGLDNIPRYL